MSDYLQWQSDLSADVVFERSEEYRYPQFWQDGIIYLTCIKHENNRSVLNYLRKGITQCLTPLSFDLKSKINEYGGKPFWLFGDSVYFVNAKDQCLYQQQLAPELENCSPAASAPQRISPAPVDTQMLMYTQVIPVGENRLLLIVEKKHTGAGEVRENHASIALLFMPNASAGSNAQIQILQNGADFYSNLVFDARQQKIAWVQWNHPNMPWDANELWVADLLESKQGLTINNARRVPLEESASVCQLLFTNRGELYFSADFVGYNEADSKNYWNIYAADLSHEKVKVTQITFAQLEYGYPQWQYGDLRIAELDNNTVISFATSSSGDQLCKIDLTTQQVHMLPPSGQSYQHLSADNRGSACAVVLSADQAPNLGVLSPSAQRFEIITDTCAPISSDDLSLAELISYPTRDAARAYGYHYAPRNSAYSEAVDGDQPPPLIVMVHGGPTARAYGCFDIQKQFWTQRGFAVLDVNHRGSSGQGRAFRDSLYGQWGAMDTSDIIDAIDYLVVKGKAEVTQVCIRGKSAGGYAVLTALTQYPKVFKAGACYYGIGNLATLAATTHKFEKYYTDRLIGETFSATSADQMHSQYWQRSPINHIDRLQSAMIVFQGALDNVVPPQVAHELIRALKDLGLAHSYVEYEDEGHGFRQSLNCIDALTQELDFYREHLK